MYPAPWCRPSAARLAVLALVVAPLLACGLLPGASQRPTVEVVVTVQGEDAVATVPAEGSLAADTPAAEGVIVTVIPEDIAPAVTPAPTVAMRTYTDPVGGYTIDFPAAWYLQPQPGGTTILTSWDMSQEDGHGGLEPGMAKIDVVADPEGWPDTIDAMAAQVANEGKVLEQYEVELTGGVRAIRMAFDSEMGGRMALLFAAIGDHRLILEGYGDLTLFDTVAASLRAADAPRK